MNEMRHFMRGDVTADFDGGENESPAHPDPPIGRAAAPPGGGVSDRYRTRSLSCRGREFRNVGGHRVAGPPLEKLLDPSTKTGLAYRDVANGKGAHPKDSNKVTIRYKALLTDGREVDSTAGKPDNADTFKLGDLVPGLKEAVGMMTPGSRWNVLVPPQLAYGANGTSKVPPNALVIYDVELVKIQ